MPRRKVAAILALDVVSYSKLMTTDELGTLRRLGDLKQNVLLPAFQKWGGVVFKEMGDGMLVEFASVVSAVESAQAIQQSLEPRADDPTPPD